MEAVECLGAHEKLTVAVCLLAEARDHVADVIDGLNRTELERIVERINWREPPRRDDHTHEWFHVGPGIRPHCRICGMLGLLDE